MNKSERKKAEYRKNTVDCVSELIGKIMFGDYLYAPDSVNSRRKLARLIPSVKRICRRKGLVVEGWIYIVKFNGDPLSVDPFDCNKNTIGLRVHAIPASK